MNLAWLLTRDVVSMLFDAFSAASPRYLLVRSTTIIASSLKTIALAIARCSMSNNIKAFCYHWIHCAPHTKGQFYGCINSTKVQAIKNWRSL